MLLNSVLAGVYGGMRIIEDKPRISPKIKLSDSCPCSDEFRQEFNQYLLDTFGVYDQRVTKPGEMLVLGDGVLVIRTEDLAKLKQAMQGDTVAARRFRGALDNGIEESINGKWSI